MWVPYEQWRGHAADFRVRYRFYTQLEGGRATVPRQGYRGDFAYADDPGEEALNLYAIHPEFEDCSGEVILEDGQSVPAEGTARMWILVPSMRRDVHVHRIAPGVRGFIMEGARRVGEVEVLEQIALLENAKQIRD
ncbi:hypothetical protein B9G55_14875 [Saccharibacillus sp. O16]|nr:hypothetical protein B9G55_14875 [Saccharibacillus sp. O16]